MKSKYLTVTTTFRVMNCQTFQSPYSVGDEVLADETGNRYVYVFQNGQYRWEVLNGCEAK